MELSDDASAALQRFFRHLPQQADLTLIVLKGHLLVEQQMRDIVRKRATPGEAEKIGRWTSFHALTRVTRAYGTGTPEGDWREEWWDAIDVLNKLRNELAHQLESKQVEMLANRFVELVGSSFLFPGQVDTVEHRVKNALGILSGGLTHFQR